MKVTVMAMMVKKWHCFTMLIWRSSPQYLKPSQDPPALSEFSPSASPCSSLVCNRHDNDYFHDAKGEDIVNQQCIAMVCYLHGQDYFHEDIVNQRPDA